MQETERDESTVGLTPQTEPDAIDTPLERLELLAGDDAAIASFLDDLDVRGPREREMLTELARTTTLADPVAFATAHPRAVGALESLARHGYHGSGAAARLGRVKLIIRYVIELVARYIVISFLRTIATSMRNLYWLREIQAPSESRELILLRPARMDAEALQVVFKRREIGLPTFVIGGVLIPISVSIWNLSAQVAAETWWMAVVGGALSALMVIAISWVILRGAAMANRRIRLAAEQPLQAVWNAVGNCGQPPHDRSRKFAVIGIVLSVAAWIVLPIVVAVALAT